MVEASLLAGTNRVAIVRQCPQALHVTTKIFLYLVVPQSAFLLMRGAARYRLSPGDQRLT